jgi:hypothetical protein
MTIALIALSWDNYETRQISLIYPYDLLDTASYLP